MVPYPDLELTGEGSSRGWMRMTWEVASGQDMDGDDEQKLLFYLRPWKLG